MKVLESITLHNGITIELIETEYNFQVASNVTSYCEIYAHLDKAKLSYNKKVDLYKRFQRAEIN